MKVFIDTSAFYALSSKNDNNHSHAVRIWEGLKAIKEVDLLTTNYVLLECLSLIQNRHGAEKAEQFAELVSALCTIQWVDEDLHQRAWGSWKKKRQNSVSLVDHVGFTTIRESNVDKVFVFDKDFVKEGFQVLS